MGSYGHILDSFLIISHKLYHLIICKDISIHLIHNIIMYLIPIDYLLVMLILYAMQVSHLAY